MLTHVPLRLLSTLITAAALPASTVIGQDRLVSLPLSTPAPAPPGSITPDRTSPNAAARYEWLAERMNRRLPLLNSQLSRALGEFKADSPEETAELERLLSTHQDWMKELVEATTLPLCDFQRGLAPFPKDLPRKNGKRPVTPQGKQRYLHQILIADGLRLWAGEQRNDSAERFAAALRHCRHVTLGPSELIDALTASALLDNLAPLLREIVRPDVIATLNPESQASLAAAILQLDPGDPLGERRIWREHRQRMLVALEAAVTKQPIDSDAFDALTSMRGVLIGSRASKLGMDLGLLEHRARQMHELMPPLTRESIIHSLARAKAIHTELETILDAPDAAARLAAIDVEVNADDTAVLLTVINFPMPLFQRWQDSVSLVNRLRHEVARITP